MRGIVFVGEEIGTGADEGSGDAEACFFEADPDVDGFGHAVEWVEGLFLMTLGGKYSCAAVACMRWLSGLILGA